MSIAVPYCQKRVTTRIGLHAVMIKRKIREELLLVQTLAPLTFKTLTYTRTYVKQQRKGKQLKKHNRSPLSLTST